MKAVRMHETGGVEKLAYEEAPDPAPGPGEVLVRVRACALNHLEVWATLRPAGERFPRPRILGSDIAGVVEALGPGVTGVQVGAKVMLQPGVSCGHCQGCLSGWDNTCPSYTLLGVGLDGGFAELVVAPVANLVPMPENLGFEEAASIPLVFLTAWHMLDDRGQLRPGETALVNAAGSGVGIAGVQIAKLMGAWVIASAGSDAKLAKARELGADAVINYNSQDLAEEARRLSDGRGVDLVMENVGGQVFEKSLAALAPQGRLVTCGATAGGQVSINLSTLYLRQHNIIGCRMGSKGQLLAMIPHFAAGRLRPVVDRIYPLREAQAAVRQLSSRDHFGKVVLVP